MVFAIQHVLSMESHGSKLHGMLYMPADNEPDAAWVICDPFAEEKKCAHRPLTDAARMLCARGCAVLRFDYRGCGDSQGRFAEFTPHDWVEDLRVAATRLRQEAPGAPLGLAGLRMGCSMAHAVALEREDVRFLMLWEPIIDGAAYVKQNLKRSMVKAMLTRGDDFAAEEVQSAREAEIIDLDGYEVSPEAMRQLGDIGLADKQSAFDGPLFVLNIGTRQEPGEAYGELARRHAKGTAAGVRLEPFWNRIGLIDVNPMLEATGLWLTQAVAGDSTEGCHTEAQPPGHG